MNKLKIILFTVLSLVKANLGLSQIASNIVNIDPSGPIKVTSLKVADLNEDGTNEIWIANASEIQIYSIQKNESNEFERIFEFQEHFGYCAAIEIADLNSDGKRDILAIYNKPNDPISLASFSRKVMCYFNIDNTSFSEPEILFAQDEYYFDMPQPYETDTLIVKDMNNDGLADFADRKSVYINSGGQFSRHIYQSGFRTKNIVDINLDGFYEIIVQQSVNQVEVYNYDDILSSLIEDTIVLSNINNNYFIGDIIIDQFVGDEHPELLLFTNPFALLFELDSEGVYVISDSFPQISYSESVFYYDMNSDNLKDIIHLKQLPSTEIKIVYFEALQQGGFGYEHQVVPLREFTQLAGFEIYSDNEISSTQILLADAAFLQDRVELIDLNDSIENSRVIELNSLINTIIDINNDSLIDIIQQKKQRNNFIENSNNRLSIITSVLQNVTINTPSSKIILNDSSSAGQDNSCFINDINSDGLPDLLKAEIQLNNLKLWVYTQSTYGVFDYFTEYDFQIDTAGFSDLYVYDIIRIYDEENVNEFVHVRISDYTTMLFEITNSNIVRKYYMSQNYNLKEDIQVVDFNSDGIDDVIAWNPYLAFAYGFLIFGGNDDGTADLMFSSDSFTGLNLNEIDNSICIADFDSNLLPDICYNDASSGTVFVQFNNGNFSFSNPIPIASGLDSLFCVITSDVNGDNLKDILFVRSVGESSFGFIKSFGDGTFDIPVSLIDQTYGYTSLHEIFDLETDNHKFFALENVLQGKVDLVLLEVSKPLQIFDKNNIYEDALLRYNLVDRYIEINMEVSDNSAFIEIYSLDGKLILSSLLINSKIDISFLQQGLYSIIYRCEEEIKKSTFLKID